MEGNSDIGRIEQVLESLRHDAKAQLAAVMEMIDNADGSDIKALATIVIAAENAVGSVERYCQLGIGRVGDAMAQPA